MAPRHLAQLSCRANSVQTEFAASGNLNRRGSDPKYGFTAAMTEPQTNQLSWPECAGEPGCRVSAHSVVGVGMKSRTVLRGMAIAIMALCVPIAAAAQEPVRSFDQLGTR